MKRKAFTLIELIVVVAIIAIVAAMIVGAVHKVSSKRSGASSDYSGQAQSPLNEKVVPPAATSSPVAGSVQFQVNSQSDVALVKAALERAGYKVEPVTDKINLVYKPQ
jgi:prepilin-type N-terminal cleavage/methylation domain-containing protein